MVKIFNPIHGTDPLATMLDGLGKQLFGDSTANALKGEQLYAAQRENTETDNLMRRVGASGAQNLGADPIAQAILIGSGFDPSKFGDLGLIGAATQYGARDPRTQNWQVGSGQAFDNTAEAFDLRLGETRRNNDMHSADRRYGVDQSRAQQMHEFENVSANDQVRNAETQRHNRAGENWQREEFLSTPKPALGPDGPVFVPQGDLAGGAFQPILSETDQKGTLLGQNWGNLPQLSPQQQEVLGARVDGSKTGTPRNYIRGDRTFITYDGVTDAQSGQPLPVGGYLGNVEGSASDVGLTNSTQSGVQQGILANNKLSNLLGATRELAQRDPTNFGIPGFIKGVAQDAGQIAQGLAQGLGYQGAEQMLSEAQQSAMQNGVDPNLIAGVFDPNLTSLHTLSDLMVYAAAEALAGQSGRSVSDKDVTFFKGIVGSPQDWMMSQEKFLAKLTQIERLLQMNQQELGAAQTEGAVPRTTPLPGAPAPQVNRTSTGATWRIVE